MPQTDVRVFRCADGIVPLVEWLDELRRGKPKAHAKCVQRILMFSNLGFELRRPIADVLRDGIYDLRFDASNVNYRILYFFCGANVACLSHGLTKESIVPLSKSMRPCDGCDWSRQTLTGTRPIGGRFMARTKNYADVLRSEIASNPALAKAVEDESFNADIAMKVFDLRTEAGLTQRELADLIDTQQSVISRIEAADYKGRSLDLLRRIAAALGKKVRIEFYDVPTPPLAEGTKRRSIQWMPKIAWPVVPQERATPAGSE